MRRLARLSENERAVIVMFHQEECTYEQIAMTLKLPLNTVRTHLHRGRQKMKDRLKARLMERRSVCQEQIAQIGTELKQVRCKGAN